MKLNLKTIASTLILSAAFQTHAQNLVQTININLSGNDPATGRGFTITTRDIIRYFTGTNLPGAQLQLVTPVGNPPGTTGNLGAWLRVTQKGQDIVDVTSPDESNVYQDTATVTKNGTSVTVRAVNRFSISYGDLPYFELQGFSTWHMSTKPVQGVDTSSTGAFTSSVNGIVTVGDGVQYAPVHGTISAGGPRPE